MRSSHGQLLWAGGLSSAAELWRYIPGTAEPERLYTSPRGDSVIQDAVASGRGYAFVETSPAGFGEGGWRIFYLPASGADAIELDRGLAPGAAAPPTLAMDEDHVAWASFDEPADGPRSRLRVVAFQDVSKVSTLIDHPIADGLLWYPALNGDELWYGVIHAEATPAGDESHLESLSIAEPSAPVVFDGVENDFNPAVTSEYVVWKTVTPEFSALNWGTVYVQDRKTHSVVQVPVPDTNRPTIGERFIAFEEITHRRLAVYDLRTRSVLDLIPPSEQGNAMVGGQSIGGNLLAFFTQTEAAFPRIGWAFLPD